MGNHETLSRNNLIFDIGMHDGQDTAYFLACGYRVIAVEANPLLVKEAEVRFRKEIESNRLVIVPRCISDTCNRDMLFWINSDNSALSSFDREVTARMGHAVYSISVQSVTLSDLIIKYGTPYYLKIDIEAADHYCMADLSADGPPHFLSVELTSLEILQRVKDLGYSRFKLIEQRTFASLSERIPWNSRFLNMMCHDLANRNLGLRIRRRLARWVLPLAETYESYRLIPTVSRLAPGWQFVQGSSGPFGDETSGLWTDWDEIVYLWVLHLKQARKRNAELWCDLHASF